jgi:hypothetical protein
MEKANLSILDSGVGQPKNWTGAEARSGVAAISVTQTLILQNMYIIN